MTKLLRSLMVAGVAALGLVACSDDDGFSPDTRPQVRVVHASPDAPNVDVLVEDATILTNVPYLGASRFLRADAGTRRVRVTATGGTPTVIDANVDLATGGVYTIIATGLLSDIQPLVIEDDPNAPTAGQAKIRVVHGAPSAPTVDVYATAVGADIDTATPVLTNVPFRAFSGYLEVPAGTYQLRVTPAGTKDVAISANLTVVAGQIRTVVARDAVGGGSPFNALVLADRN